jgi:hypothetical protein
MLHRILQAFRLNNIKVIHSDRIAAQKPTRRLVVVWTLAFGPVPQAAGGKLTWRSLSNYSKEGNDGAAITQS